MQYIVQPQKEERNNFYLYLIENGYTPVDNYPQDYYINNRFPFVIEDNNTFWICESITCCACAAQRKRIISVDSFKNKK